MKTTIKTTILIALSIIMFLCCIYSADINLAIKKAISTCVNMIIPSLLPCIFISNFIIQLKLVYLFPKKFQIFSLFIISLISGYPVGANILNECVINNQLKPNISSKLLPSFINSGPGFVISLIGGFVLKNKQIGLILYLSQCFASFILFVIFGGFNYSLESNFSASVLSKTFFNSLEKSFNSLKNICLLVLLFISGSEIVNRLLGEMVSHYFLFFGEITSAVLIQKNIYTISFLLSWCGVCVYLQIYSITEYKYSILRVVIVRLLHAAISIITTKILMSIFKVTVNVFSSTTANTILNVPNNLTYVIVITFSLICLLFSINRKSSGKIEKDLL